MKIGYIWQREEVDLELDTGPVLHVRSVIRALQRRGHHVRLATFHEGQPAWTDDLHQWHYLAPNHTNAAWFKGPERVIRGIQSRLHLPYARLFDSAHFADAVMPTLEGYDILYERYDLLGTGGLMAARRLGIPLVYELNGDLFEEYSELGIELSRGQWVLINRITGAAFHRAAGIVAVSDKLNDSLLIRWQIPPDRISVITNGVDVQIFVTAAAVPNSNRNGTRTLIHVGSFQPWHSLDLLVDAFARMPVETDVSLLLVGDGQERESIERQVQQLGLTQKVNFAGAIPHSEVPLMVASADVAVMSHRPTASAASGTPLKLLEYMAAGRAIVAPDMENISAVVTDQKSALLFQPGDTEALTAAMTQLLSDNSMRNRLGLAAQDAALRHHSWDHVSAKLEELFTGIFSRQASMS